MKQIIVLLIFITTFGCAGSGRNPGGESAIFDDDSTYGDHKVKTGDDVGGLLNYVV